jgi:serine/threonine-protein kinase HipA
MLLNPGSSLGGAWPKASVKDEQGNLYMAKFSNSQQEYDVVAWEAVAMTIAAQAGIRVPEFSLKRPARGKSVFLSRRFDRSPSGTRLPYISAMTMLQAKDGEVHSYAELAEYMSQYTANPRADLKELWCRIALSIMVTNVDDHPRNHGFLRLERKGWQLSPLFDVNPTPEHVKGHTLSMDIVEGDNTASLNLLCACADIFYIRPREAEELLVPIARAVSGWRSIATNMGIPAAQQEEMAGAFEHAAGYNSVLKP